MWWKYFGILLLIYVFAGGFLVPLKPGIMAVNPDRVDMSSGVTLDLEMYNTNYAESDEVKVLIRLDASHYIEAEGVDIIDRNTLRTAFDMPGDLPDAQQFASASLIVHDPENGFIVSPSALILVKADSMATGATTWSKTTGLKEGPWRLQFPFIGILYETIRNTFFHVAIWFAMFFLMAVSMIYSIRYLHKPSLTGDAVAASYAYVSILFGIMGMVTGSIWAKNTWGVYWTNDPKLNMAAVALIIYVAYAILRSAINDPDQKARVSAAYNIFAVVAFIPLVFVIPRLTSSLHPGNGGNPALGGEDLDNTLRMFFYPAIIGLTLIGSWMATLMSRLAQLKIHLIDHR